MFESRKKEAMNQTDYFRYRDIICLIAVLSINNPMRI